MSSSGREDEERAERLLTEALEGDANNPAAHRAMGNLRRLQGRLADSRIELETAIALDRNDKPALLNFGITLLWAGQPELAIPYLEKSFRLSPHDPYVYANYFASGACHLFLGHVDQAIDLFRKARAANPRVFYLHLWLAGALGLKGQLDEARSALGEAVKLKPEVNSLAQWRASQPYIATPPYWALRETTLNVGLRRAGFPTNDRYQFGCRCISKPAARPARRAASAGDNVSFQRLASKSQPLTVSASHETTLSSGRTISSGSTRPGARPMPNGEIAANMNTSTYREARCKGRATHQQLSPAPRHTKRPGCAIASR
jgi:tetratricopeptide (TPR) repeat protein